jgi:hypothetical protein
MTWSSPITEARIRRSNGVSGGIPTVGSTRSPWMVMASG